MPDFSGSTLLQELAALTARHPLSRKRLIGIDVNFGREVLQSLAKRLGGWIGWEAVNLRSIADELAFVRLSLANERIASDVEVAALVNEALDSALMANEISGPFAELSGSLGFRRALRDSLLEVRTGGVSAVTLRRAGAGNASAFALATVLERFEALLTERLLADPARVLRVAIDAFDEESPFVLDGIIALATSLSTRGLAGELLARLVAHGASVLQVDTPEHVAAPGSVLAASAEESSDKRRSLLALVSGSAAPDVDDPNLDRSLASVDVFVSVTPAEEIREVCRRVVTEGLRWDDVEIVATDPDTYGVALDALSSRVGISATMLKGIPLARTRLGRTLERWMAWIGDGLPADVLRQALEAGEIGLRDSGYPSSRLAAELRTLKIGWGRDRYESALIRLKNGESITRMQPHDEESADTFAERKAKRVKVQNAIAELLRKVLVALPPVSERGNDTAVRVSVNALATAALSYLELVAVHGQAEQSTMERLRSRLGELENVAQPEISFSSAFATFIDSVSDLRAWPISTSERKPWSSAGGMLHLVDVAHAGTTGRPRIFVVGLDADRTRGGGSEDALLSDRVRNAVGERVLATSNDRYEAAAWRTGVALASLRGRVTLSYSMNSSLDGREAGPSPLLLQAWRLVRGDAALSFEDMRQVLMPPTCAVPASGSTTGMIDARDVWFDALVEGALILDGGPQTREAFPALAAGFAAFDAANDGTPSGYHGLIPAAGAILDPMINAGEISPSSLESFAGCPLAWFYKNGLEIRLPNDPEYDPEQWLDSMQRGSLLHAVYEQFITTDMGRQDEICGDAARSQLDVIVDAVLQQWRTDVPPPSEMVYSTEVDQIRRDAVRFLYFEREQYRANPDNRWNSVELAFGRQYGAAESPVPGIYELPDGRILLVNGRVDRVDKMDDGNLRIIDYKTGSAGRYEKTKSAGPFNGGRQLQPALYAAAVETISDVPVSSFEFRFPTEKGESAVVSYSATELQQARAVVGDLIDQVQRGEFIPTNDSADCGFCEFQSICRASTNAYHKTTSPRAIWAAAISESSSLYEPMRTRRGQASSTSETNTATLPEANA